MKGSTCRELSHSLNPSKIHSNPYSSPVYNRRSYIIAHLISMVRVFILLLSGLFCCLGFSVCFSCCLGGACFIFCCLGGCVGLAQTAKKNTPQPTQQQKKHAPAPSEHFFLAVWVGGRFFLRFGCGPCCFCCLGGCRFFCLLFGRVVVFFFFFFFFFFCLGAGRAFFFAVWAGGVFFSVWAGDGSSLTYRSAWLVFKGPNNEKDQTTKNKHGFRFLLVAIVGRPFRKGVAYWNHFTSKAPGSCEATRYLGSGPTALKSPLFRH